MSVNMKRPIVTPIGVDGIDTERLGVPVLLKSATRQYIFNLLNDELETTIT